MGTDLIGHDRALLTDLYQLTMAYGYWRHGRAEEEAVFHLFFRRAPFGSGFTICAGLGPMVEHLERLQFSPSDLEYLASLSGSDQRPLFEPAFLDHLAGLRWACDVDAVPEGTAVFPHEPLVRVRGPLIQAQLLETPLLNLINFPTLVATKAARICRAAAPDPVLEFGLRRAQGPDGGVTASRAAYIGGCAATSNLLAGKLHGIPVRGTHAHSWVSSHADEACAFRAWADAMPNNALFLVDTYDSLGGTARAIEVGKQLRAAGHELIGIRLDSGDLAALSIKARAMLDEAGFPGAVIVASDDLDERRIGDLKAHGARIGVWGVGTRLATCHEEPALGGVYKLSAIRAPGKPWSYKLKLSEQPAKVSNPGILDVRRYSVGGRFVGDVIHDVDDKPGQPELALDPTDPERRWTAPAQAEVEPLLVPVFRAGQRCHDPDSATDARDRTKAQLAALDESHLRLEEPAAYPVGLAEGLFATRRRLIRAARDAHG